LLRRSALRVSSFPRSPPGQWLVRVGTAIHGHIENYRDPGFAMQVAGIV
jgi:hypothetical protein